MSHPSLVKHHQVLEFRRTNLIVKFLDSPIALSEKFNLLLGKVAYDSRKVLLSKQARFRAFSFISRAFL